MTFNIFKNKTVLITGHTGFKGSWLTLWLISLGANVVGISNDVPTTPSHFEDLFLYKNNNSVVDLRVDIRDVNELKKIIREHQPDFIFHLAAQALVRKSYDDPLLTFETNAFGTVNLLQSLLEIRRPAVAIIVTSDKVYENNEWVWGYRETDRLGGVDPYSASKGMAELAIHSYVESFYKESNSKLRVGVVRAGNVIGGGDWALDRIVPDCIRAWSINRAVDIRRPNSTRPWQHVLEPISGYLSLASNLFVDSELNGSAFNFGPLSNQDHSVRDLIEAMSMHWVGVKWNDLSENSDDIHEANLLKLNCDKSLKELKWQPSLNFNETVMFTAKWYRAYYENKDQVISIYDLSLSQINQYCEIARSKKISWAISNA